jgi:alanine racemase
MAHRKTYAKINLDHLDYNLNKITSESGKSLFCVVKANAYGHGIVEVSKHLIKQPNVQYLCVSSIDEAILLRKSISFPIINLGYTDIEDIEICILNKITVSLPSLEWFYTLLNLPIDYSELKIHIKIDSGMNRLGIKNIDEYKTVIELAKNKKISFEGIFSHYHSSDDMDNTPSFYQLDFFKKVLNCTDYNYQWIHIANSEAIIDIKDSITNAVRCGLSMYGYSSKAGIYKPILSLYTTITQAKKVSKNETIGYSATYIIENEERIAILPIGYADGLNRKLNHINLYINGNPVKILGNICMDQTIIEYPLTMDQKIVEIMGANQNATVLAETLETIPYEVLTGLSYRITRKYYQSNHLVHETSLND